MIQQSATSSQLQSADCPDGNQIGALVEGKLDAVAAGRVTTHLDGCMDCQELVAFAIRAAASITAAGSVPGTASATMPSTTSERTVGERVGRYELVERIGAGAMGVVYRAIDPRLERQVALKLVRDETADSRARLEHEAQLAAKLQHPNVVTIYDTGAVGDDVFVSMEYVDGKTLSEWMRERHDVRAVVEVFGQAARGLAAAHRAGLVHRDFKPSNVLVGGDGRVRLADFGLARRVGAPGKPAFALGSPTGLAETKTGELVGTPLYMSPEQHRGQVADASSDQFAFCVALYEALYHARPFRGTTLEELAGRVITGSVESPPRTTRVPTWLRDMVVRGLSVQREDRFASMDELAAKLSRGRARRRWRNAVATVAVIAFAGSGAWMWRAHERTVRCHGESSNVTAVFDDAVAAEIGQAFAATGVGFASSSAERVTKTLRRYTRDLADGAESACFAERDEAQAVVAARRQCFAVHTAALVAFVRSLERPDATTVQRAVEDVWGSVERSPCADDAALLTSAQSSRTLTRDQIQLLGTAHGLLEAQHTKEGIALVTPMLDTAKARNDRVGELAASLELAALYALDANRAAGAPLLQRAVELAETEGLDSDALSAYALLATGIPSVEDTAARHRFVTLARAKLERTKRTGGALEAKLALTEAQIDEDEFHFPDAEQQARRAIDIATRELGEDHPLVGRSLSTLATILRAEDRRDDELDVSTRAVELLERALGTDHPDVASAQLSLASALVHAHRLDEARALLLHADASFTRALGADHPVHGRVLANLADVEKMSGHWEQGVHDLEQALGFVERSAGPASVDAGDVHFEIAEAYAAGERYDDALREAARSLAILEAAVGNTNGQLVSPLLFTADVDLEIGHAAAAIAPAERGIAIMTAPPSASDDGLAEPRMILARALWDGGGDRARSRALAEQARATVGDQGAITVAQIDEWLSQHPKPR